MQNLPSEDMNFGQRECINRATHFAAARVKVRKVRRKGTNHGRAARQGIGGNTGGFVVKHCLKTSSHTAAVPRVMPPTTSNEPVEAEQLEKRPRKSVERLSSSKLQAAQYSPSGFSCGANPATHHSKQDTGHAKAAGDLVNMYESQRCHRCKRGDHEDKMLLCDSCDKGWHLFCLNPPLLAIPEGEWNCPVCLVLKYTEMSKEHLDRASASNRRIAAGAVAAGGSGAVEQQNQPSAKNSNANLPSSLDSGVEEVAAGEAEATLVVGASSAKWARPIREEGLGGAWMVGRRLQVYSEPEQTWREGRVEAIDVYDDRWHHILFVGASETEDVNLSKAVWKLDRSEGSRNAKSGKYGEDEALPAANTHAGSPAKRHGRPKKNLSQPAAGQQAAQTVISATTAVTVVPAARAVDPNACKEPLRKKLDVLYENLDDTPIYAAVGGARAKKGRRDGTLEYDADKQQLLIRTGQRLMTIESFVEDVLGPKERPKEHIFLCKNDEALVEYETTLAGYGRQKLVDGTRIRLMFDDDDWYSGKVIGYDAGTARYRVVFEDGEEAECRHALFEPGDGFFLDNGKDCGMIFRERASTSCTAALAADEDADKDRWRAPGPGEEAGGEWLVGKRIRVFWPWDSKFHEAVVEDYNPDPNATDSRNFVGPTHIVRYDESKSVGVFPENLIKCVWNIDKSDDKHTCTLEKGPTTILAHKRKEQHPDGRPESAQPIAVALMHATNNASHDSKQQPRAKDRVVPAAASSPTKSVLRPLIDEGECMWTAPHWKFKTGGAWMVGRKIKLYWDAERQWFTGRVLSYDGAAHAQDSHGNIGPVHEVSYDDGIFYENLAGARWKLDANEGPSGNALTPEKVDKLHADEHGKSEKEPRKQPRQRGIGKDRAKDAFSNRRSEKNSMSLDEGGDQSDSSDASGVVGETHCRKNRVKSQAMDERTAVERRRHESSSGLVEEGMGRGAKKDAAGVRSSLPGGKIVLKLPAQGEKRNSGDCKRLREGEESAVTSTQTKKICKEKSEQDCGVKNLNEDTQGDARREHIASETIDLSRLDKSGQRWTTPGCAYRSGGKWLIGRCVRVFWDEDVQWYPGIVIHYDGRADAQDSHGDIGPIHTVVYKDGTFDENLNTAKWQIDLKEGLAGFDTKGEREELEKWGGGRQMESVPDDMSDDVRTTPRVESRAADVESGKGSLGEKEDDPRDKGWRSECNKLLGRLMRNEKAIPFLEPVDPVAMNLPDYFDIINKPMDLGTVRSKLENNRYSEAAQVLKDIVLCFDNAIEYNPPKEPAHKLALGMHVSFTSLCNGSQVLRPVLRCLDLSRKSANGCQEEAAGATPNVAKKMSDGASPKTSPKKTAPREKSSPKKAATCEKDAAAQLPAVRQDEKSHGAVVQAAKRGGPRLAAQQAAQSSCASDSDDKYRLKIHSKGRQWTTPTGSFCQGGQWLVGRHVRVYWDDDRKWFPGVVTFYDARSTTKDSHGNKGPVHDVYYEDGSFLENLGTAQWQFDLKEGAAGQCADLSAETCASEKGSDKKPSHVPSFASFQRPSNVSISEKRPQNAQPLHTDPHSACETCRTKRIRCIHMQRAAAAQTLFEISKKQKITETSSENSKKPKIADSGGGTPIPVRQSASVAHTNANASVEAGPASAPLSPSKPPAVMLKPQKLCGVKQDQSRKELEYEVAYAHGKTQWTTGLNRESNFRALLLAFIEQAFPDHSVLHPWMPDFKKHMWTWGFRENQLASKGPEGDKDDTDGVFRVSGVQVLGGNTMYRLMSENAKHKWHTVTQETSLKLHKMAADFLFGAIGVLSLYMGKEKHAKFLRHLGAYEEYFRGWECFEQGLYKSQGDSNGNGIVQQPNSSHGVGYVQVEGAAVQVMQMRIDGTPMEGMQINGGTVHMGGHIEGVEGGSGADLPMFDHVNAIGVAGQGGGGGLPFFPEQNDAINGSQEVLPMFEHAAMGRDSLPFHSDTRLVDNGHSGESSMAVASGALEHEGLVSHGRQAGNSTPVHMSVLESDTCNPSQDASLDVQNHEGLGENVHPRPAEDGEQGTKHDCKAKSCGEDSGPGEGVGPVGMDVGESGNCEGDEEKCNGQEDPRIAEFVEPVNNYDEPSGEGETSEHAAALSDNEGAIIR